MKRIFILLAILTSLSAQADRKDSIRVWGEVTDMFTGEILSGGTLVVTDEDGSIALQDSIHGRREIKYGTYSYFMPPGYEFKLPKGGKYTIQFNLDGYSNEAQELTIPDRQYHKYTTEWKKNYALRKLPKEHKLGEAVVTATRIKMVVKGDTVEYNADAFNMAEGSMLDKLLESMPGMRLMDNGVIMHNGKKVESLLVNGKDFFKGDPKVAMENLPAYTVKKVQVYRKDDDKAYLIDDSLEREDSKKLVVDVILKKEYSKGWMFNSDLAHGTSGSYKTKLFGMYFTDALKFLLCSNINNLNETGSAWSSGDWYTYTSPMGHHTIRHLHSALEYDHKLNLDEKWTYRGNMDFAHNDNDDRTKESSTTYLTSGDIYGRSKNNSLQKTTSFTTSHDMQFALKKIYINQNLLYFNYTHTRGNSMSNGATFSDNPIDKYRGASLDSVFMPMGSTRLEQMLINRTSNQNLSDTKRWSYTSGNGTSFRSPIYGNNVELGYNFSYNKTNLEQYQHYMLDNRQTSQKQYQNIYNNGPVHNYNYTLRSVYKIKISDDRTIGIAYDYNQSYDKNNSMRYRLDSLAGWGEENARRLGLLPSTRDSMAQALDIKNSYHTTKLNRNNNISVGAFVSICKDLYLGYRIPLTLHNSTAWDNRNNHHQRKKANATYINPNIGVDYWNRNNDGRVKGITLRYTLNHNFRDAAQMFDITDDTNPLFIVKGNPSLKDSRNHSIQCYGGYSNAKHMQNYHVSMSWNATEHSIANAVFYDRSTGITTYQPKNISGNWNANYSMYFERSLDKKDRFMLTLSLREQYNHNVDYITDTNGGQGQPIRSTVHYNTLSPLAEMVYQYKQHRTSFAFEYNWNTQNSHRDNFTKMNSMDIKYSLRSNGPIAWGLEYNTNLLLYSRRGYNDKSMNDDILIWNLSLSRSFLKGKKLTLQLEAVDILGQVSEVRTVVNSQGRRETWHNAMPRYMLLHVGYKFNTMAKKKKGATETN